MKKLEIKLEELKLLRDRNDENKISNIHLEIKIRENNTFGAKILETYNIYFDKDLNIISTDMVLNLFKDVKKIAERKVERTF